MHIVFLQVAANMLLYKSNPITSTLYSPAVFTLIEDTKSYFTHSSGEIL